MAGGTVQSGTYVHHVREIDVVRQGVNPDPRDRLTFFPVSHQLLYFRRSRGDEQMAGATVRYCWNAGNRRLWCLAMAEETLNGVFPGMYLMAEGKWLARRVVLNIQRQNVHQCQPGDNNAHHNSQTSNEP